MKSKTINSLLLCSSLATASLSAQNFFVLSEFGSGSVVVQDSIIVVSEFADPFYGAAIINDITIVTEDFPPPGLFSSGSTAVKDMAPLTGIRAYPNPTFQELYLTRSSTQNTLTIQLRDISGILKWEIPWMEEGKMQIDLSKLSSGVYFVVVMDMKEGKGIVFKVTKQQ